MCTLFAQWGFRFLVDLTTAEILVKRSHSNKHIERTKILKHDHSRCFSSLFIMSYTSWHQSFALWTTILKCDYSLIKRKTLLPLSAVYHSAKCGSRFLVCRC